jgi:hypothetical protein
MNKFKLMLATSMLAVFILSASMRSAAPKHDKAGRYFTSVTNLYAYNGTIYTQLVSTGYLSNYFTVTASGSPVTITNSSGNPEVLVYYTGTKYDTVYSTINW